FGDAPLPRAVLDRGFDFDSTRVPLVGPQGIFKPAILPEVSLTPTTTASRRPASAIVTRALNRIIATTSVSGPPCEWIARYRHDETGSGRGLASGRGTRRRSRPTCSSRSTVRCPRRSGSGSSGSSGVRNLGRSGAGDCGLLSDLFPSTAATPRDGGRICRAPHARQGRPAERAGVVRGGPRL